MLGIFSSIACGLSWGVASFTSGRSSRTMSAPLLTAMYNFLGIILFGSLYLFSDESAALNNSETLTQSLITGVIGGLGFSLGLVCIARGMSRGRAGIISPLIAVVSIVIPVIYTAITGELPNTVAMIGIALLILVPYLASRTHKVVADHVTRSVQGDVVFGIMAGTGFGAYFIGLIASPDNAQLFTLTIIQTTSFIAMMIVHIGSRASWSIPRDIRNVVYIFLIFELIGVVLLRVALNNASGAVVSAISGSVDPVGILVLSRIFNKELFTKPQIAGFGVMVVGIVLVSLNS
jgi:drug/metabolite transporter (DMT)-like permease